MEKGEGKTETGNTGRENADKGSLLSYRICAYVRACVRVLLHVNRCIPMYVSGWGCVAVYAHVFSCLGTPLAVVVV